MIIVIDNHFKDSFKEHILVFLIIKVIYLKDININNTKQYLIKLMRLRIVKWKR